jgi:hypothetical protein
MRFAYWATKTADTRSECVILSTFLCQQWLREGTSMLPYTDMAYRFLLFEKIA